MIFTCLDLSVWQQNCQKELPFENCLFYFGCLLSSQNHWFICLWTLVPSLHCTCLANLLEFCHISQMAAVCCVGLWSQHRDLHAKSVTVIDIQLFKPNLQFNSFQCTRIKFFLKLQLRKMLANCNCKCNKCSSWHKSCFLRTCFYFRTPKFSYKTCTYRVTVQ